MRERDLKRMVSRSLALAETVVLRGGEAAPGVAGALISHLEALRVALARLVGTGDLRPLRGRAGRVSTSWRYNLRRVAKYVERLELISASPGRHEASSAAVSALFSIEAILRDAGMPKLLTYAPRAPQLAMAET